MTRLLNRLIDVVSWEILFVLDQRREGLRFNELTRVVDSTPPVIWDRLKIMKKKDLVRVILRTDERTERNYFVHAITPKGLKILRKYKLKELLREFKH